MLTYFLFFCIEKAKHAPQVMDMEHELKALRVQLVEKSKHSLQLRKEVNVPSFIMLSRFSFSILACGFLTCFPHI